MTTKLFQKQTYVGIPPDPIEPSLGLKHPKSHPTLRLVGFSPPTLDPADFTTHVVKCVLYAIRVKKRLVER